MACNRIARSLIVSILPISWIKGSCGKLLLTVCMYQYKTHSEKNFEKWFKTSPTGNCTFDKDIFQLKFGHYLILYLKSEKDSDEELIKE